MKFQTGSSLLEVLITLVILSVGLLGFANANLIALRTNQSAYFQSLARAQLDAAVERLYACQKFAVVTNCWNQELVEWKKENAAILPAAKSIVSTQGTQYQFKIRWQVQSNAPTTSSLSANIQL